jgi:hypothetical protein
MTRRLMQVVLILATVAGGWVMRPAPVESGLDLGVEPAPPAYVGCIGAVERDLGAVLSVGSIVRGEVDVMLVAPRDSSGTTVTISPAGGAEMDLAEAGAAGTVGLLVELPTSDAGAAVVASREESVAAIACTRASTQSLMALGGSTATGETLDLVITNPYAGDAIVSVGSSSESGEDSASEIATILVPARTTVVRSLEPLLSLRQSLSVRMEVQRGAVHAGLIQTVEGDVAMIEAVEPAQDWWLPALSAPGSALRLVVATDSPLPVDIVVDSYSAGSVTEGAFAGTIDARSQIDIPLAELGGAPLGLRVSADGPVVAAFVVNGPTARAVTPGTTLSTDWVLPGSGVVGSTVAWVLNPGELEAELVLQPLAPDVPAQAITIPADSAVSVPLDAVEAGYLFRSSSEIAVFWSSSLGGLSLATGHPLLVLSE